jgi:uncharacterized membrane protein YkoI
MNRKRIFAGALIAAALATTTAAHARDESATTAAAPGITITQAIATAEQHGSGRAVEAEFERGVHGPYYEVKVVGQNGVHKVYVDATDGKVLASRQKNLVSSWLDFDDDDDHDDD